MPKILVVEDEPDILRVLHKRLSEAGFEVFGAVDAYQGMQRAREQKPDLVILDLMIPAGGGLSLLKNMRASMHIGFIPVIVLTGMENEKYRQEVMDEGVEAYLQKPYDPQELLGEINRILKK
jgi:two-component system, OmpR family, alkaline phosphatase synthesis response regulator PhoP